VLAIILALASAIGYGGSDFAAGLASRDVSVIPVTLLATAVSSAIVAAAWPFAASPEPRAAALAWGFGAGLGGTLGAFALYLGYRHAAFSVAGPLSAVGSAGFSVLAGLLYGERPTNLALAGIVLALPAIVAVSVSADEGAVTGGGGVARGVAFGLVAGAGVRAAVHRARPGGFGQRDVAGRGGRGWRTGRGGRGGGAGWAGGPAHGGGQGVFRLADSRARLLAMVTGAAGAAGTILFFFATHQGFLAVTAVLTSLYPAVTIVLARTVLGERLTAMRLGGLALAGICVSLIAVGGAS